MLPSLHPCTLLPHYFCFAHFRILQRENIKTLKRAEIGGFTNTIIK